MGEKETSNIPELLQLKKKFEEQLHPESKKLIDNWQKVQEKYTADFFEYTVREKVIKQPLTTKSLSGTRIPKVVLPK